MSNTTARPLAIGASATTLRAQGWDVTGAVARLPLDGIAVEYDIEAGTIGVEVTRDLTQGAVERLNTTLRDLKAPRLRSYWRAAQEPSYADRVRVEIDKRFALAHRIPLTFSGVIDGDTVEWGVASTGGSTVAVSVPGRTPKLEAAAPVSAPARASDPILAQDSRPIFDTPAQTLKPFKVYHDAEVEKTLRTALREHKAGEPTVVMLTGPTGVGKTLTASQISAEAGYPFRKIDAMGLNTFADWMGMRDLVETPSGQVVTDFVPSLFCEAVSADGPYAGIPRTVLLDEVNRGHGGASANVLLPITDGSGTIYVPDARKVIRLDPAVLFVFTANIGANYTGTNEIDAALMSRVDHIANVPYPSAQIEARIVVEQGKCTLAQAELLVKVANQTRVMSGVSIRQPGVATRQLVKAGRHVAHGMTLVEAATSAFVNAYDEGEARKAVRDAVDGILRPAV